VEATARIERVVLALCIAAFCVAMGLRESLNIWVGTGAAAVVSFFLLRRLPNPPTIRAEEVTRSSVMAGLAVGTVMAIATWTLYPPSAELVPAISSEVPKLYALLRQPPGPLWAFPVLVLVVAAEEWVWRGLAIRIFLRRMGPAAAVVVAAVIYVLPQVAFRSPLLVVVAFLCGLVWGALRVWTRGLAAPLIAHLLWDLLVFVLFPVE
jgi:membrane protease YdiL (CAAX protease family)